MDRAAYQESPEQRFPYILPVLRSYKQSVMFLERNDWQLPDITRKAGDSSKLGKKKRKSKVKRKLTMSLDREIKTIKQNPQVKFPQGRSFFND
jgi:hypothetical protein